MSDEIFWRNKLAQLFHDPYVKAFCQGETAKLIARDLAVTALGAEPASIELLDDDTGRLYEQDKVDEILWSSHAQHKVAIWLSQLLLGEELVTEPRFAAYHAKKINDALADFLDLGEDDPDRGRIFARLEPDLAAAGADRPVLGDRNQIAMRLWREGQRHIVVTHPLDNALLQVPTPTTSAELLQRLQDSYDVVRGYASKLRGLEGRQRYRVAWHQMWRLLPEDLAGRHGSFWPVQPADTRCPDHSIWDHLRVTSALAGMPAGGTADDRLRGGRSQQQPWLLSLWVGPADAFLGAARSGRDLWTGSLMLSELAFALIEPVVRELGADCVLYPDLRANLRADLWLFEQSDLGNLLTKPGGTRASLIPNRLVALVPEGRVDELAAACLASAGQRWQIMAGSVRALLLDKVGPGAWTDIFDRQMQSPPAMRWCAVPWTWDGKPKARIKRSDIVLAPALPFVDRPDGLPPAVRAIEEKRARRFEGWVERDVLNHYQGLRQTALITHPNYLLGQRGFDYPLIHHQLLMLDDARRRAGMPAAAPEPGEKCTACGVRQVLAGKSSGSIEHQRKAAREFWSKLDEDENGSERLCGPCAIRRFLSDAKDDPSRRVWHGTLSQEERESRGQHAIPFPSTGLIAGQKWLARLCKAYIEGQPRVRVAVADAERSFRRIAPNTQFIASLPRLRRLRRSFDETLENFMRYDFQVLEPQWWDRADGSAAAKEAGKSACRALTECMSGGPAGHIAVIMVDGDQMGRLLIGAPDRVGARWRDVLHPDAVAAIQDEGGSGDTRWKTHWRASLDRERAMGPSTHAFVTRALRHFSNRILPWVVERERGGRLIYAGGDEALILCPAEDALPMVERLHQLFTAPWVLDCSPTAEVWPENESIESSLHDVGSREARTRFQVSGQKPEDKSEHRLVPMLGKHQSLSAGIAFGPYKTSLRRLRGAAARALADAKAAGGRGAGLAWFTRNGAKLSWVAPLIGEQPGSTKQILELAGRFASKKLPTRLPYKLREMSPMARAIHCAEVGLSEEEANLLLNRLVCRALDGASDRAVLQTWRVGLERDDESSLDGLLIARALRNYLAEPHA